MTEPDSATLLDSATAIPQLRDSATSPCRSRHFLCDISCLRTGGSVAFVRLERGELYRGLLRIERIESICSAGWGDVLVLKEKRITQVC